MDLFSTFSAANEVYLKLQSGDGEVDVSLASLDLNAEETDLSVKVSKGREAPKILTGDTPYQVFTKNQADVRGLLSAIKPKLQKVVEEISKLPVSLYRQYGEYLRKILLDEDYPEKLASFFFSVLQAYPGISPIKEDFEICIRFQVPAKISVFFAAYGVCLVYRFSDKSILLSGFKDPELVKYEGFLSELGIPTSTVGIREDTLSENFSVVLLQSSQFRHATLLHERVGIYQQTVDDVLDDVVQRLTLLDALDAVQDVIISDDREIFMCFDPVLEQDEIESVVASLRELYPQTELSASPENDVDYWVVGIQAFTDTAVEVADLASTFPGGETEVGTIAKEANTTIDSIIKDLDMDAAIAQATKG